MITYKYSKEDIDLDAWVKEYESELHIREEMGMTQFNEKINFINDEDIEFERLDIHGKRKNDKEQ